MPASAGCRRLHWDAGQLWSGSVLVRATVRGQFPEQAKDLDIAAFADGQVNGYSVTAEIFPNMAEASRLAQAAWQEILVLGQAPATRIIAVGEQIEAAQKQAG